MTFHPSPAAIRAAMDKLEAVAPLIRAVDMCETRLVRARPECGTVCCHGGAYLFASYAAPDKLKWVADPDAGKGHRPHSQQYVEGADFIDGALKLARDLGFTRPDDQEEWFSERDAMIHWAEKNPDLWGNTAGFVMFASEAAFGKRYDELTLEDIIAHWRGVADRIEALNAASSPA